ncbi:MAG: MFS transporter [Oscillospiraceae bacterium]|nr:MFS transporter [Oscillospiraceae bacterium]
MGYDYLSNAKRQYWITLFQALIPAYVIERLFWQARGVGVQGVVWCEIIYAVTVTLLEIPSGILADRFGRKRMLLLGCLLDAAEMVILLFARSFWAFGLAVFLAGVGRALSSGSGSALLYDSLLAAGKQDGFERTLGRLRAIDMAGSMAAALSGGLLANRLGFEFNYLISACAMGLAFLAALTLREPPMITKPESGLTGNLQYAKQALALFRAAPLLLLYCLTGTLLGACLIYLDEFWQLLLEGVGVPVALFGLVGAGLSLCRIPANLFAYRLKERHSYRAILLAILAVSAAGYLAVYLARKNALCLVPMAAMYLAAGAADPLVEGYLHHRAESQIRATTESIASLALRVLSIPLGLVFGWVSTRFSIFAGYLPLAMVCSVWVMVFLVWHRVKTGPASKQGL